MVYTIRFWLSVAMISATMVPSPLKVMAGMPFLDDFNDKDFRDGVPVNWRQGAGAGATRDASTGDLMVTSTDFSATMAQTADRIYDDLSMRTQLRMSGPAGAETGFYARSTASNNGMLAELTASGLLSIYTYINGTAESRAQTATGLKATEGDINLQFDLFGNQFSLTAWNDGSIKPDPQVHWQDSKGIFPNSAGTIGVWQNPRSDLGLGRQVTTTYRFIEVVPEPSSAILAAFGLSSFGLLCRRTCANRNVAR